MIEATVMDICFSIGNNEISLFSSFVSYFATEFSPFPKQNMTKVTFYPEDSQKINWSINQYKKSTVSWMIFPCGPLQGTILLT